jgi:hypothetical protein
MRRPLALFGLMPLALLLLGPTLWSEESPPTLGGLYWISTLAAGDEKPVFGEPVRVAGEGAADPAFLEDGSLIFHRESDGEKSRWRHADGKTSAYQSALAPPAPPSAVGDGELLAAQPIPGSAEWTLLIKNPAEHPGESWLYRFDPAKGTRQPIIAVQGDSRLFAWDGAGRIWLADGTQLARHCPACGGGWRRMVDLRRYGLGPIEALAIAPTGSAIAVVVRAPAAG